MANPNIATSTSIYGNTSAINCSTTATTLMTCASNNVIKLNTVMAANYSGSSADVTVTFYKSSTASTYYLAYTITVPAKSTLVIISKDTAMYLNESDYLQAYASAGSVISVTSSYETIS